MPGVTGGNRLTVETDRARTGRVVSRGVRRPGPAARLPRSLGEITSGRGIAGWATVMASGAVLICLAIFFCYTTLDTADKVASVIAAFAALIGVGHLTHSTIARRTSDPPPPAAVAAETIGPETGDADVAATVDPAPIPSEQSLSNSSVDRSLLLSVNGNGNRIFYPQSASRRPRPTAIWAVVVLIVVILTVVAVTVLPRYVDVRSPPKAGAAPAVSPAPAPVRQPEPTTTGVSSSRTATGPSPTGGQRSPDRTTEPTPGPTPASTGTKSGMAKRTPAPPGIAPQTATGPIYRWPLGSNYDKVYITRDNGFRSGEPGDFQVHPNEAAPKKLGARIGLLGSASSCDDVTLGTKGIEFTADTSPVVVCGLTHLGLSVRMTFSPRSGPGEGPHQLLTVSFPA